MTYSAFDVMEWEQADKIAKEAFREFAEPQVDFVRENQERLSWNSEEQADGAWLFKMSVFPSDMMRLGELIKGGAEEKALPWVRIKVLADQSIQLNEVEKLQDLLAK